MMRAKIEDFIRRCEKVANSRDNEAAIALLSFPFVVIGAERTDIQEPHIVDHAIEQIYERNKLLGIVRKSMRLVDCRNPEADCPLADVDIAGMDADGHAVETYRVTFVLRRVAEEYLHSATIVGSAQRRGRPIAVP